MKVLARDEIEEHYRTTFRGGLSGGLISLCIGGLGVYLASRRYVGFRRITPAWRGYMITSAGTFGAIKSGDYSSRKFQDEHHPDYAYQRGVAHRRRELQGQHPFTLRVLEWVDRNQAYMIVGSWMTCLGTAWHLLGRSAWLNKAHKLVQARIYAQGLTVAIAIIALALHTHVKDTRARYDAPRSREHLKNQDQWQDMVESEVRELEEAAIALRRTPIFHKSAPARHHCTKDIRDMRAKADDQINMRQRAKSGMGTQA